MKVTTIEELQKVFKYAIEGKHALEIHLTSDEFPQEIDLIPYDQVQIKSEFYLGSVKIHLRDDDVSELFIPGRIKGTFKRIERIETNYGYSAVDAAKPDQAMQSEEKTPQEVVEKDEIHIQIKTINKNKDVYCKKCGEKMRVDTRTMLLSNPPQYTARCGNSTCNAVTYIPTHQIEDKVEWVSSDELLKRLGY